MQSRNNHMFDPFAPGVEELLSGIPPPDDVDMSDPMAMFKYIQAVKPGGLPMPELMEPPQVRQRLKERASRVLANHDRLRRILERHEPTIQKRWTKKTKQQRLQVLLDAWPNMAAMHRPDFAAFRTESMAQRESGTKYRERFFWPYINQEDLLRPKSLLLMLNSRGRHHPSDFAASDGEAMHLGRVTKALVPIFLNGHVVMLNGVTGSEYGKLYAWEDHEDAFDWMAKRTQFIPGEALDILEAQDRLMKFLVHCCEHLLHDIPATELLDDKYPVQPEPVLKSGVDNATGFDSLVVMAEEAPYRPPGQLDFGRIESLLAARTSAAEDDLWSLREDPGYFRDELLIYREHRQEMMKDTRGNHHPVLQGLTIDIFWERVIGNVLLSSHAVLEIFSELGRQAEQLRKLQAKYAGTLSPLKDLPEDYLVGILRFRLFLNECAKEWLNDLKTTVAASPPMRHLFVRLPAEDLNKIAITSKPGLKKSPVEQELLWLLSTLWEDGQTLFFARMPMVVDELERLLRAEPRARELVSGYIADRIGDLSIICECLRQLDIYQPWANGYEYASVDRQDKLKQDLDTWRRSWAGIHSACKSKAMLLSFKLATPSEKHFFYPTEKRRTKETVDALRQAEANLDAFWERFDKCLAAKAGDLSKTALQKLLSQGRMLQRTPEWIEPAQPPKAKKTAKPAVVSSEEDAMYRPLSTLYFEHGTTALADTTNLTSQPKAAKVKTRGAAADAAPDKTQQQQLALANAVTTNLHINDPQHPEPTTFPVDARALKVFRTLFFQPAVTSTPGEVSWTDFLHAMTSTGLFRAEKLYGSVWHFQPSPSSSRLVDVVVVERSIQFHEPHPVGKIPFTVARRMGRRLNRAYGWVGGMFVLRK